MQNLEIDKAQVLQAMQDFNTEDSERASDAGESRQRIGEFLEETGINNKAFSHCRMILRMKKDDKRQDWLRSMRALMPIMEAEIAAIGTKDAFDVPAAAMDQAGEEAEVGADQDETAEVEAAPVDADIAGEAEEFEAALAEVMPEAPAGNVKKFKPRKAAAAK